MCNWILDLVGLALLLLVVFLYVCKPRNQIHTHRLLPLLVLSAFLSTASDLFYALWENYPLWFHSHVPLWVNIANNYVYFLFHLPCIAIYSLYLLELNHVRDAEDPVPKLFWVPLAVLGPLLLLNPLTSWFFHTDADGMYHRGPLRFLWYIGVAGYVIHGYYLLLKERDEHMRKPLIAQTFFLTFAVIGTMIQFFHPSLLVENYTIDLSIFVSFVSLSRLEDVTEWNTGLFNRDIFTLWCERDFKHHTPFTLVLVHMKDWKPLNESLGDHAFHCKCCRHGAEGLPGGGGRGLRRRSRTQCRHEGRLCGRRGQKRRRRLESDELPGTGKRRRVSCMEFTIASGLPRIPHKKHW